MSETAVAEFECPGCERRFAWKEQLAGKKARCKCGNVINVPRSVSVTRSGPTVANKAAGKSAVAKPAVAPPKATGPKAAAPKVAVAAPAEPTEEPFDDGLYDFANYVEPPGPPRPVIAVAGASGGGVAITKSKSNAAPQGKAGGGAVALGYQRGQIKQKKDRFSAENLMDLRRDVYVPAALLVGGTLIYIAYFCTAYHLRSSAVGAAAVGVTGITVLKTLLLIGFALLISGPLGVSFGGVWTAILKLAAVAVFCDGVASWVDYAVGQALGPRSGLGGLVGSFLMAFVIYWSLFTYLFGMDTHDSFLCTRILFIFDRVVRWGLFLLIINLLASGITSHSRASSYANPAAASDPLVARVKELKDTDCLGDARQYIAKGNQAVLKQPVDDWYAAGCPNVWIEESRADINGRWSPLGVIVELPDDPAARAKCFATLKAYYDGVQIPYSPIDLKGRRAGVSVGGSSVVI